MSVNGSDSRRYHESTDPIEGFIGHPVSEITFARLFKKAEDSYVCISSSGHTHILGWETYNGDWWHDGYYRVPEIKSVTSTMTEKPELVLLISAEWRDITLTDACREQLNALAPHEYEYGRFALFRQPERVAMTERLNSILLHPNANSRSMASLALGYSCQRDLPFAALARTSPQSCGWLNDYRLLHPRCTESDEAISDRLEKLYSSWVANLPA